MVEKIEQLKSKYWRQTNRFLWLVFVLLWVLSPMLEIISFEVTVAYSLFVIMLYVSDINSKLHQSKNVTLLLDRSESLFALSEYIHYHQIRTIKAILGSGSWLQPYIANSIQNNADIKIFVQHPDSITNRVVFDELRAFLAYCTNTNVEIYLYKEPLSYEGVNLNGDFILSSWYTYSGCEDEGYTVWGASNMKLIVISPSREYEIANEMFNRQWERLKKHANTLAEYLAENPEFFNSAQ